MLIIEAGAPRRPPRVWWRRRRWLVLGVLVLVIGGGVSTALAVRAHGHKVVALSCACGLSWAPPDAAHSRDIDAGVATALQVPPRPGHTQSFYVEVMNTDSRTQTVLGLPSSYSDGVAEPAELAIARPTGSESGDEGNERDQHYTSTPQSIAPGRTRWLRFTVHVAGPLQRWTGRSEVWSELTLRVRVDGDVHEEDVDFGDWAFVIRGRTPS